MIVLRSDRKPTRWSGLLITFEGGDGTGKTTALEKVYKRLQDEGRPVLWTEWDDSKLCGKALRKGKRKQRMSPITYTLLSACNIADRWQTLIGPFLRKGGIVCADRWKYTSYARDVARGNDPDWVRECYQWCPDADLAVYFECDPAVALQRKLKFEDKPPKYYEAGLDVYPDLSAEKAFLKFQGDVNRVYRGMVKECGMKVLDADQEMDAVEADAQALVDGLLKAKKAA